MSELDLLILMGPFQFGVLYDPVKCRQANWVVLLIAPTAAFLVQSVTLSVPNWVLQPSKSWTWQADSGQSLGAALAEGSLGFLCALGEPLVRRVMPGMYLSLTFHRR